MPHKYIRPYFVYTSDPDDDKLRMQSLRTWDEVTAYWNSEDGQKKWTENSKEMTKWFEKHWEHEKSLNYDYISYHDGLLEFCEDCKQVKYRVLERKITNGGCCGTPFHVVYLKEKPEDEYTEEELDNLIDRWHDGEGKGTYLWEWLGWSFEKYKEYVGGGEIKLVFEMDKDNVLKQIAYILKAISKTEKIDFINRLTKELAS